MLFKIIKKENCWNHLDLPYSRGMGEMHCAFNYSLKRFLSFIVAGGRLTSQGSNTLKDQLDEKSEPQRYNGKRAPNSENKKH